jgi:drug/metabolite transporter (DMT)-like permease
VRSSADARFPSATHPLRLNALAVFLALGSAITWGVADFSGGLLSRRLPTLTVTAVSQLAGFVALLVALALRGGVLDHRSFELGILAGLGGGAGLAAFYKALSLGTMSIVSPLAACGALLPFTISLATGERPTALALGGAGLALAGAVAVSLPEQRSQVPERVRAVALALVAAIALGLFTYFLGLGSREGSPLSTLVGARVGSLAVLGALAIAAREPLATGRRLIVPVVAVGLCDVSANALFALASGHGLLSLVSVLGSLYPIVTVLAARVLLGERLSRGQMAAVGVALVGVCALAGS